MFFLSYCAGYYQPSTLKINPPVCGITAHAAMPGWSFPQFWFQALIQMNGA
jgi:hypothetical protein